MTTKGPAQLTGANPRGRRRHGFEALLLVSLVLAVAATAPVAAAEESLPALVIAEGSLSRSEVVAIGRDLVVDGEALSDVAAISGTVHVAGRIGGDLIVLGGDARLAATARVEGDLFVLGGAIHAASGSAVGGRSVAYPTVTSAWLTLLEGPSLGLSAASPIVVAAKLALVAAWLLLTLLLFATSGREVLATAEAVRAEPFRNFFVGLTGVLALALTGLFFSAFAAALVGLPLLALVVVLALLLKLWGMVAVFYAAGDWTARRLLQRRLGPLQAAILGLLLLGVVKLLPWIGVWSWSVATLIGVGASLTSKFGRRQPWFQVNELEDWTARSTRP